MGAKKAISVTLDAANLLWLKGQAAGLPRASISEVLDRIVTEARFAGRAEPGSIRSVVGSIELPEDDPHLDEADTYIRSVFAESIGRPLLVRERAGPPRGRTRRRE